MGFITIHIVLLLVLCGLWYPAPVYGRDVSPDNNWVVQRVAEAFPQKCQNQRYCILLTSIQRCVGCGVMAVNGTIELLHQIDSSFVCIVVLAVEDRREAEVVRQKFLTPFFLADTTPSLLTSDRVLQFPELLIIGRNGKVVYHRNDLQHSDPEYIKIRQVLSSDTLYDDSTYSSMPLLSSEQKTEGLAIGLVQSELPEMELYLEEPDFHPISRLSVSVYNIRDHQISAINTLTNSIDSWRVTDGRFVSSLVLPDSIRYRFRKDSTDWRWRDMEKQGGDIAKLRSLAFAGDTLYAIVDILGGYTQRTTVGKTPAGTIDSVVYVVWQNRQIIVRVHNGSFLGVIEPTEPATLVELCTINGMYGGTSIWTGFSSYRPIAEQMDSIRRFTFYWGEQAVAAHNPLLLRAQQYMANAGDSAVIAIGKIAASQNGALWYCAPENRLLLHFQFPDQLRRIEPQGALRQCTGSILLGEKVAIAAVYSKARFNLKGITTFNNNISLFLGSSDSSQASYLLQYYSSTGTFLGEQQLPTRSVESALLAGSDNTHLIFLLRTTDTRRWKLLRVPVPEADIPPVSQENSTR